MLDFVTISVAYPKKGVVEIFPEFETVRSKDLMVRGKSFYAIWDEKTGLWSKDQDTATDLIDAALDDDTLVKKCL